MDHLLCRIAEQYPSQHKATKDANTWLQEIERFMELGGTWREALNTARGRADHQTHKRTFRRIPGLLSPAGVLTLMIMDYPDHKYMERIGRLGLGWTMDNHKTLRVGEGGFWARIQENDVRTIFAPPKPRELEVDFLADYDKLLGDSDTQLREQLWSPPKTDPLKLKDWLRDTLSAGTGGSDDVQTRWFTSWTRQMSSVKTREEQTVVQSLFFRSLCVFHRLRQSNNKQTDPMAYLLLDIEDGKAQRDDPPPAAVQVLDQSLEHSAWKALTDRVAELVSGDSHMGSAAVTRFRSLCGQQVAHFREISRDPKMIRYTIPIVAFDRRRSKAALVDAEDATSERDLMIEAFRDALCHHETTGVPRLTRWQQRCLLHPRADVRHILTGEQWHIYQRRYGSAENGAAEETSQLSPLPVAAADACEASDGECGISRGFDMLFNDLTPEGHHTTRVSAEPSPRELESPVVPPSTQPRPTPSCAGTPTPAPSQRSDARPVGSKPHDTTDPFAGRKYVPAKRKHELDGLGRPAKVLKVGDMAKTDLEGQLKNFQVETQNAIM
ncbi:hypothetical protein F5Y14DRAFT_445900 [Nemania sp. NC0429]|nr:hypothetical protein F5Y14DRAFT_445900 [Nemania sp. NC0429]